MPSESLVLVQFPAYGVASKIILRILVRRLKTIVLVHDVDRLRQRSDGTPETVLKFASFIIFTGKFQAQLAKLSIPSITLGAWDYRLEPGHQCPNWDRFGAILFAGSLSHEKNGWLYQDCPARPRLLLYGNKYKKELNPNADNYQGEFAPDSPLFQGPISWGLVWEGNSTSRRSESDHHQYYERFNQPHKLSLYLACGLPVIVWKKAAIADFVREHRCGILVDRLEEVNSEVRNHTEAEILRFRENAVALSAKVRSGYFIRQAVQHLTRPSANLDHAISERAAS